MSSCPVVSPGIPVHGPLHDDGLVGDQLGGEAFARPYLTSIIGMDGVATVSGDGMGLGDGAFSLRHVSHLHRGFGGAWVLDEDPSVEAAAGVTLGQIPGGGDL